MPFCYICNRIVEVAGTNTYPDREESLFSCGHTSRLFKRSISESVNITEKVEITPKEGEKIPITVSGDAGVRLQGDLNRLDIGSRENRPIYINRREQVKIYVV